MNKKLVVVAAGLILFTVFCSYITYLVIMKSVRLGESELYRIVHEQRIEIEKLKQARES